MESPSLTRASQGFIFLPRLLRLDVSCSGLAWLAIYGRCDSVSDNLGFCFITNFEHLFHSKKVNFTLLVK